MRWCEVWGGMTAWVCVRMWGSKWVIARLTLKGHSHKDNSDQGLHQRPDIPQSEGLRERSSVNTFYAQFKVQAWARYQHKTEKTRDRSGYTCHVSVWVYRGSNHFCLSKNKAEGEHSYQTWKRKTKCPNWDFFKLRKSTKWIIHKWTKQTNSPLIWSKL